MKPLDRDTIEILNELKAIRRLLAELVSQTKRPEADKPQEKPKLLSKVKGL